MSRFRWVPYGNVFFEPTLFLLLSGSVTEQNPCWVLQDSLFADTILRIRRFKDAMNDHGVDTCAKGVQMLHLLCWESDLLPSYALHICCNLTVDCELFLGVVWGTGSVTLILTTLTIDGGFSAQQDTQSFLIQGKVTRGWLQLPGRFDCLARQCIEHLRGKRLAWIGSCEHIHHCLQLLIKFQGFHCWVVCVFWGLLMCLRFFSWLFYRLGGIYCTLLLP